MIREYNISDIDSVNNLGTLLSANYQVTNKLEEYSTRNYEYIYVYELDNKVVGFIQIETHFDSIDLINIIVDEKHRRNRIASKLLEYVVENFDFINIILEVNESNSSAINFYLKNGFVEINRRKKYYGENDALIMERSK